MKVIVLNTDMSILGTTSAKRAVGLLINGKAEPVTDSGMQIHPKLFLPTVIRLLKAVRNLWKKAIPWSKQNIHVRDNYTCQYCGNKVEKHKATIDHVIPVSRGGTNSYDNTVCACFDCNNEKNNRTPSEARMSLKRRAYQPTIMEFVMLKVKQEGLENTLKDLGIY